MEQHGKEKKEGRVRTENGSKLNCGIYKTLVRHIVCVSVNRPLLWTKCVLPSRKKTSSGGCRSLASSRRLKSLHM